MSKWVWIGIIVLAALLVMVLAALCFKRWVEAQIKMEKILIEELQKNDIQDNSEDH